MKVIHKFFFRGELLIFLRSHHDDYFKAAAFANGRNWRIVHGKSDRWGTIWKCEQIIKSTTLNKEIDLNPENKKFIF